MLALPASPVAQEALAELAVEVARVELALVIAKVLELNPVKAVLELVIAQAVELETVPVVALVKIKSGTEPHHHGQVRAPKKVEDMVVAAAETMRARAATEAARAWAAAE